MKKIMIGTIIITALIATGCTEDDVDVNTEDTRPIETKRYADEDTIIDDIKDALPEEIKEEIDEELVIAFDSPWVEADPEDYGIEFNIDEGSKECYFCHVKEDFSEGTYIAPHITPEGKIYCCYSEECKARLKPYQTCLKCGAEYSVIYPWEKCFCKSCGYDPNKTEEEQQQDKEMSSNNTTNTTPATQQEIDSPTTNIEPWRGPKSYKCNKAAGYPAICGYCGKKGEIHYDIIEWMDEDMTYHLTHLECSDEYCNKFNVAPRRDEAYKIEQ